MSLKISSRLQISALRIKLIPEICRLHIWLWICLGPPVLFSHLHLSFICILMSVVMRLCIDANLIEHSEGKYPLFPGPFSPNLSPAPTAWLHTLVSISDLLFLCYISDLALSHSLFYLSFCL